MSSISAYPLLYKSNKRKNKVHQSTSGLKSGNGIEKVVLIDGNQFLVTIKMTNTKMVIIGDNTVDRDLKII
jgi:hypothetical protein